MEEKLKELLANGTITQEEFDALIKKEDADELEKRIQAGVDKVTAKLGKEKADLQKELDRMKKEKLTEEERKALEIKEREDALAAREKELSEKTNRLYAIKKIQEAGLNDGSEKSLAIVDFVIGADEAAIDANVKAFSELVNKLVAAEVEKKFKENGRNPNGGNGGKTGDNPYAKETFNLTKQWELELSNPELAAQLQAAAK